MALLPADSQPQALPAVQCLKGCDGESRLLRDRSPHSAGCTVGKRPACGWSEMPPHRICSSSGSRARRMRSRKGSSHACSLMALMPANAAVGCGVHLLYDGWS